MSMCLDRETMQAFLEKGLPDNEMTKAQLHIAHCDTCDRELQDIRATMIHVDFFLDSLAPNDLPAVVVPPAEVALWQRRGFWIRWTTTGAVGLVSAATVVLLVLFLRPYSLRESNSSDAKASLSTPVVAFGRHVAPHTQPSVQENGREASQSGSEFIPLDDGPPVEDATIVRISLSFTSSKRSSGVSNGVSVAADVLVDESGQVRAIRFLN